VSLARPIRLAVLDDGLFVRTAQGTVHPVAATFSRFVEAVARNASFGRTRYIVPVRALSPGEQQPVLPPVDESVLEIVPTTSFSGIADYLVRAPLMSYRNWGRLSAALADADLLWLRLPASNGLLALTVARRLRVPHFGWLAGSVSEVAAAQARPAPLRWAAQAVGAGYDAVGNLAARGGPMVKLDGEMFASVVSAVDVAATAASQERPVGEPWKLMWAGRLAAEKGVEDLIAALRILLDGGHDVTLTLIGDGPARPAIEKAAAALPAGRVRLTGQIGDRSAYLSVLRQGDLFVHPSRAEGTPKVVVEAMAAGLPIVASAVGSVAQVLGDGERGRLVPAGDPAALAAAIEALLDDNGARQELTERGLDWARQHTTEAQAARLVTWLRAQFPILPWAD
jgi:hypothetical protein